MSEVRQADRVKVLDALERASRLTRTEIYNRVLSHHLPSAQLDRLLSEMEAEGLITLDVEPVVGRAKRPTTVAILNVQSAQKPNENGTKPSGPPPGEGWLPKTATLKQARRGVVPSVAARAGRIQRKTDANRKGIMKTGAPRVSDEQRGATRLISSALRAYRDQGIIEERGDWIRLVRNPSRRPPHHWHEALLHFLADGHPTLDGKWRRKPKKTLIGVTEAALGRKLEPHERVRRFPGHAGSWDPRHILLFDSDQDTIVTLADIKATA